MVTRLSRSFQGLVGSTGRLKYYIHEIIRRSQKNSCRFRLLLQLALYGKYVNVAFQLYGDEVCMGTVGCGFWPRTLVIEYAKSVVKVNIV